MSLSRVVSVTALCVGALWVGQGCAGGADDADQANGPALADPGHRLLGGPVGSTGTNNLPPPDLHALKSVLYESTRAPLGSYDAGTGRWEVAASLANDTLLSAAGGRTVLTYAARCGISEAVTLKAQVGSGQYDFHGQGILSTTQGWLTTPLTLGQSQDLFTCLLAHLNAQGVEVPINLSGPSVTNTEGADDDFTCEEALWVAEITPGADAPGFAFEVWPIEDTAGCAVNVEHLEDRVCATQGEKCGMLVRSDLASACTETPAGWYCRSTAGTLLPAIKTRLEVTDLE